MKKKLTALLLAALMVVSFIPFTASAADADGYVYSQVLDDSAYYHMEYVEKEDFFKDDISLYTAIGLYDGAWKNYFTGETDIEYAKAILLGLIEKVSVENDSETYAQIISVLEGASTAANVVEKVNEYTGLLDFAESTEWAQSITILNAAIKVANISKDLYDEYIEAYAAILSAKAANIYYGDLLTYLIDNCTNSAVVTAATEILADINKEMDDAINEIYEQLADTAATGAAEAGIAAAMGSNSVTSIIYSVYTGGVSAADKIFNTSSKYGHMCTLAEIYCVEDCLDDWATAIFAGDDAEMADFAANAFITIRETGEDQLAGLATANITSVANLVKNYDETEILVRTATAEATLAGLRYIINEDVASPIGAVVTATGKSDVILQDVAGELGNVIKITDGTAVDFTLTNYGIYASILDEQLNEYVKVLFVFDSGDYDAYVCNGSSGNAYISLDIGDATYYAAKTLISGRSIAAANIITATDPSIVISDPGLTEVTEAMTAEFVALEKEDNSSSGGSVITGGGSSSGGSSSGSSSFADMIKAFFQSIADAFKNLFKIFSK